MYSLLLRVGLLSVVSMGMASANVLETPAEGLSSLYVALVNAKVEVREQKQAKTLRVNISGAPIESIMLERKADRVELKLKNSAGKEMLNSNQQIQVSIVTPPLDLDLFAYDGQFTLNALTKSVHARALRGKIQTLSTESAMYLSLQKGEIVVEKHTGSLVVDSNQAKVQVSQVRGEAKLESHTGDINLDSSEGQLSVRTAQSTVRLQKSSGSLSFEIGRGTISSTDFSGRVEGDIQEASVSFTVTADSEYILRNKNGRINISSQATVSPSVRAFVEDGELFTPNYLRVRREGNQKTAQGRLRGGNATASVNIRSSEGVVTLR